jgi:hypothetical protein
LRNLLLKFIYQEPGRKRLIISRPDYTLGGARSGGLLFEDRLYVYTQDGIFEKLKIVGDISIEEEITSPGEGQEG